MLGTWSNPESLINFFLAKGHHRLVLRVEDLRKIPPAPMRRFTAVVEKLGLTIPDRGYLLIPYARFRDLSMDDLTAFQEGTSLYRDVRWSRGFPSVKDAEGNVTLVELDDAETALAEGNR